MITDSSFQVFAGDQSQIRLLLLIQLGVSNSYSWFRHTVYKYFLPLQAVPYQISYLPITEASCTTSGCLFCCFHTMLETKLDHGRKWGFYLPCLRCRLSRALEARLDTGFVKSSLARNEGGRHACP